MSGLNIQFFASDIASIAPKREESIRGQEEERKARGQAYLECRKIRIYDGRPFIVKGISFIPLSTWGEGVINNLNHEYQSGVQHEIDCHPALFWGSHKILKQVQYDMFSFPKRTYSLINLFSYSPRKRCAFTLAEVLITLGIIGIVAAMTMPVLIQNHREKVTVTQLKKAYSVLSQAMLMAVKEDGTADIWDSYQSENDGYADEEPVTRTRFTPINLVKQLKVAKDCGFTSSGCFQSGAYKQLKGLAERDFENKGSYYKVVLSDGSILALEGYEPQHEVFDGLEDRAYGEIWVDINGKKFPNIAGKDLFLFVYTKDRILPYGYNRIDKPLSSTSCRATASGYDCTAWVLYNENMDYLYCDDLSWTGKKQCK